MELPPCPIEFETEVLVSGSLELSSEKLARGLSWLATSLKEQNKVLDKLCRQMDSQETSSLPRAEQGRMSMKDEMLSMQLNALKHEVSALPRSADLEQQRERLLAEVQSLSNSLSDRQRDSSERLQRDLAEATDSLCSQLGRIGDSVSARLLVLESQVPHIAPPSAASNQPRAELQSPEAQLLPVLDPLSASNIAAEDTEDPTDGTLGSDTAAISSLGNLPAELVSLESRVNARFESLERQLSEMAIQLETVKSSAAQQADKAGEAGKHSDLGKSAPLESLEPSDGRCDAPAASASSGEVSLESAQKTSDAETVAAAVAAAKEVAQETSVSLATGVEEAKAAASAATCAAKEMAEANERDKQVLKQVTAEIASLASQVAALQESMAVPDERGQSGKVEMSKLDGSEKAKMYETPEPGSVEGNLSPQGLLPAADTLSDRMTQVEASLTKLAAEFSATAQEFQKTAGAVPQMEASISHLQQAVAGAEHGTKHTPLPMQKEASADEIRPATVQPAVQEITTQAQTAQTPETKLEMQRKSLVSKSLEESGLAKLEERLKDLEDLQETAERRLRRLEGPDEAQRKLSAEKIANREGWRSSKSEPPSGGTVGGSWKDVQAELEHFRKLFEFIEGVLPRDAAEAMRFFNRRQLGKEVLSEMVSEVFGADVEFQNAKLQLESDFRMYTRELRREFDKLGLALKALQRDTAGSEGKLLDLAKRTNNLEIEVRTGKMPHEDTQLVGSAGDTGSADGKVQAETRRGNEEDQKAIQDLREEVKHWLETFKSSVIQALQTKPDNEQVVEFIKQVAAAPSGESIALFAKRQLLGKCASCEAPIDVDLMRVKRPQPIGLQEPWPPGDNLGAKVAIRPLNAPSPSSSSRLPKIQEPRTREAKKGMKPSPSAPEMHKETPA